MGFVLDFYIKGFSSLRQAQTSINAFDIDHCILLVIGLFLVGFSMDLTKHIVTLPTFLHSSVATLVPY
jgi:hypothetical protein